MSSVPRIFAAIAMVSAASGPAANAASCDMHCLLGIADRVVNSVAFNYPQDVPAAPGIRVMEDGKESRVGEGVWKTAQTFTHKMTFADPVTQNIVFFGNADEGGNTALIAMRMKVNDRLVSEIEILPVRKGEMSNFNPDGLATSDTLWGMPIPQSARASRKQMIAVADGYFDALSAGDPDKAAFHPDCVRRENGAKTTDFPPRQLKSCSEGMRYYGGPERSIAPRRFVVVDEERGLVVAIVSFNDAGTTAATREIKGRGIQREIPPESRGRQASSFVFEVFKIENRRIRAITAIYKRAPYRSHSWVEK
jgi:hypothetical protein